MSICGRQQPRRCGIPDNNPTKPLRIVPHFLHVLKYVEELMEARLVAWDERSSEEIEQRLHRLTQRVKEIAARVGMAG